MIRIKILTREHNYNWTLIPYIEPIDFEKKREEDIPNHI